VPEVITGEVKHLKRVP